MSLTRVVRRTSSVPGQVHSVEPPEAHCSELHAVQGAKLLSLYACYVHFAARACSKGGPIRRPITRARCRYVLTLLKIGPKCSHFCSPRMKETCFCETRLTARSSHEGVCRPLFSCRVETNRALVTQLYVLPGVLNVPTPPSYSALSANHRAVGSRLQPRHVQR